MKRLSLFAAMVASVLMASCAEMLGSSQRVAVVVPERQNWNGVELHGDIEKIESHSYELEGYFGFEELGELLNQTTTEFNLRGDVVSIVSVDDQLFNNESYTYTYDRDGHLVGKVVSFGSSSDEHRYTLDKYGCVVVDELYAEGGELSSRVTITYDNAGNDINHLSVDAFGNTKLVQDRAYDENNRCVEITFTDGDDQVRTRETIAYDAEGRKMCVVNYEGYDIVKSKVEYLYRDNEVVCTTYDDMGAFFSKSSERFDAEGRLVEKVAYDAQDAVISKTETTYNEQGKVATVCQTGKNGLIMSLKSYEYDAKGCLVKFTEDDKQSASLTVILYSYDEHLNLVKERCYMGKLLVSQYVTQYNITYRQ